MNINQTKLRKEFVETPELRTNNIKYLGQDMPLYDVVTSQFIPNPTEFENEFSVASSYNNAILTGIRMLTHTPVYHNTGLLMLTEISLFTQTRTTDLVADGEVIALCVYYKKNNEYIFIGNSNNPYINPNAAEQITFTFDDLKLYDFTADNEVIPYSEVFIKPIKVYLEDFNFNGVENTEWDNNEEATDLYLQGCSITNLDFTPYVTSLDGSFSPHMIFKYKTGSFSIDDKIPHNMNGSVHLTPEEKRQVEAVCNMSNLIFDDTSIKPIREVVDSREIGSNYAKTNLEIMCGIEIVPTDYVGKNIAKVTIRRGTNTRIDDNIRAKFINDKYLQADCFGVDGNRIRTHFSLNRNTQTENDGAFTDFRFQNFEVLPQYAKIEFRISESNVDRQDITYLSFVGGSLRTQNSVTYLARQGWVLKWLNNAPVSGKNPQTQNNMTPDFIVVFEQHPTSISGTKIIEHIANTDIHISEEEKEKLDNLSDLTTRVSNIETSIGDNGSIAQTLQQVVEDLETHTSTQLIHVTAADKSNLQNCVDAIPNVNRLFQEINSTLDETLHTNYTTLRQGLVLVAAGRMATKAIQLSRAHFTDGIIKEIHIPYFNTSVNDANKTAWLCVQIFKGDEDENTIKPIQECYFSENSVTQDKYGGNEGTDAGVSIFQFKNLEIPRDYSFVRLCFVPDDDGNPVNPNGTANCVDYRVRVLSPDGNTGGYTSFDDDLCKLIPGGNYYAYVNVVKENKLENIKEILTRLDYFENHARETRIHVTPEDKERWDNIVSSGNPTQSTYTEGNNIDISDDNVISVVTTDVIKNSNAIPTSKAVYENIYETQIFDNLDRTKYTTGKDTVGTVVFGRRHFIDGTISKITIPHDNTTGDGAGSNGYLVIQVFDEKLDSNNQTILEQKAIYYSEEQEQYDTTKGKCEYIFNEAVIPNEYKEIHLSLVADKSVIPSPTSSSNRKFRVYCLAKSNNRDDNKNENVVFVEDDECYVHWKTNTNGTSQGGANYVAVVQVEYAKNSNIIMNEKFENLRNYKHNLNSTTYATTDFLPSGTSEVEDSVQKMQIVLSEDVKSNFEKANKLNKVSIHRHNTDGSYNNMYYLQIRAWDKDTNELHKFTSVDYHNQSEAKVVSWHFDDVYFDENWKNVIVLGFVTSRADDSDFVTGTPIRVGTWNVNGGSRWYLDEWKVSWNNAWQSRTPHVSFDFETFDVTINDKFERIKNEYTALQAQVANLINRVSQLEARATGLENS